jgi:hydroxymethylpyrimidine pyrophosphatase-like HAD family hydrolase
MRIGRRVLKRENLEGRLPSILLAVDYAKSHASRAGFEIEEKQDSEGRTVAFCVDWRRAKDLKRAKQEVECISAYCRALKLTVIRYETEPFFDVYPVSPDKGRALQEMLSELAVKEGVMYLGDSAVDNPAFKSSDVSVGVVHGETSLEDLDCEYLVKFENIPDFLHTLLANDFLFSSDFPVVEINRNRKKKR